MGRLKLRPGVSLIRRLPNKSCSTRYGAVVIEVLLILPVFLVLGLAIVQFGLHLAASQRVDEASSRAARLVATGAKSHEIEATVQRILGAKAFKEVKIETLFPRRDSTELANLVEVRITVPVRALVPDLLGHIGISLANKKLEGRTVMVRE